MRILALTAALLVCAGAASAQWTAYNDVVPSGSTNPANTTIYGLSPGCPSASGLLTDFAAGTPTSATVTVSAVNNSNFDGTGPAAGVFFGAGTDAYNVFNGKADTVGKVIWYNTAGPWNVDLTFTGLDPAKRYNLVTSIDRGSSSASYLTRWTKISILDADASTYASSAGAYQVSPTAVSIVAYNTVNGYVASWTDIQPGADGDFIIRNEPALATEIPAGATQTANYGYGPAVFMLQEVVPEPMTLGLLAVGGLALLRRRSR